MGIVLVLVPVPVLVCLFGWLRLKEEGSFAVVVVWCGVWCGCERK